MAALEIGTDGALLSVQPGSCNEDVVGKNACADCMASAEVFALLVPVHPLPLCPLQLSSKPSAT